MHNILKQLSAGIQIWSPQLHTPSYIPQYTPELQRTRQQSNLLSFIFDRYYIEQNDSNN